MTSPDALSEDDHEQTQPAEIQLTGWSVLCTACGAASFNGTVPVFPTRAAMWDALESAPWGWTRRDDGRVLCRVHSAVANCDRDGHAVWPWQAHAVEAALQWRFCARCGAQFGERLRPGSLS